MKFPSGLPADYKAVDSGYVGNARPPVPPGWKLVSPRHSLQALLPVSITEPLPRPAQGVMHPFMQVLSQYLGPHEAQLYSELQSKAKPLIKLSEETRTKLEAETGDKKLAAVIVRNLRDYIRK